MHAHLPVSCWIVAKKGFAGSSDVSVYNGQFPGMQTPLPPWIAAVGQHESPPTMRVNRGHAYRTAIGTRLFNSGPVKSTNTLLLLLRTLPLMLLSGAGLHIEMYGFDGGTHPSSDGPNPTPTARARTSFCQRCRSAAISSADGFHPGPTLAGKTKKRKEETKNET